MEKDNSRIQINNLIDSAINNAITRRKEGLSELSDEQTRDIVGGSTPRVLAGIDNGTTTGIVDVPSPMPTGYVDKKLGFKAF
ncbi:hypothetical protein [Calothrix sp. UHCC 0171]|uniref:hypothetical protein n=1 Tax=Calothrix sp. UHCC 0171 TaxID=3110245 RepID=UPI002B20CC94|nr:hypothetical protein [Calothrix sp. UHCC 0171]MEA5574714.1 hypothetical protein [Calothrix sp. UHCC 0171]